ncbi:MAG: hypothetical protein PHO91_03145 [Patescibacteria group bacterium]|nr:hypothetical protein [Patescibacteria group bacterium]
MKKIFIFLAIYFFSSTLALSAKAQSPQAAGSLLALSGVTDAAVYYIAADGRKYVFPDAKTYYSWYADFSEVRRVTVEELDKYPDGGAVTYRPGTKLLTHQNTARIYAVEPGGVLRWVPSQSVASKLYGSNWPELVYDVIPGYFSSSYSKGSDLSDKLPDGTVAREESSGYYYYIAQGQKRRFADLAAVLKNNFDPVNIRSVLSLADYPDGPFILDIEEAIAHFNPWQNQFFFEEEEIIVLPPVSDPSKKILFLSGQLGANLYEQGQMQRWLEAYNRRHNTEFNLEFRFYPSTPYVFSNHPYDFWNLWVEGACQDFFGAQCLESLAADYDMIVFKHSYQAADLLADLGGAVASAASQRQSAENYKLQYRALRDLFDQHPKTVFIALTLPPRHRLFSPEIDLAANTAFRAREFSNWLNNYWPKENNPNRANAYVFDLRAYLSDDGLYLKNDYELSHNWPEPLPNQLANEQIGPIFVEFLASILKSFHR